MGASRRNMSHPEFCDKMDKQKILFSEKIGFWGAENPIFSENRIFRSLPIYSKTDKSPDERYKLRLNARFRLKPSILRLKVWDDSCFFSQKYE
jgi:hypothetical protein